MYPSAYPAIAGASLEEFIPTLAAGGIWAAMSKTSAAEASLGTRVSECSLKPNFPLHISSCLARLALPDSLN